MISTCGSRAQWRSRRLSQPIAMPKASLADQDGGEGAGGLRQRERAGGDGDDREAIQDQRGGIIGEALAFQHHQHAARQSELARNRQRRDHVRRRDDGAEQEADAPGQPDQIMRGGGDRGRR